MSYSNPLDQHVSEVVNVCWNYAGRANTYEEQLQNAVLGLAGEAGEVADLVKKLLYHTPKDDGAYTDKFKHELGDVAFYFGKCLELLGLSLEEVLAANREKLASRHPEMGQVKTRFGEGYIR